MSEPTPAQLRVAVNEIVAALLHVPPDQKLAELKRLVAALPPEFQDAAETLVTQTELIVTDSSNRWEKIAVFVLAAALVLGMIIIALFVKEPTVFQLFVFRIALALGSAGIAWFVPGFIDLQINIPKIALRAGGAIAVFVLIYMINPPNLLLGH